MVGQVVQSSQYQPHDQRNTQQIFQHRIQSSKFKFQFQNFIFSQKRTQAPTVDLVDQSSQYQPHDQRDTQQICPSRIRSSKRPCPEQNCHEMVESISTARSSLRDFKGH